jgi:hypothetical protein
LNLTSTHVGLSSVIMWMGHHGAGVGIPSSARNRAI